MVSLIALGLSRAVAVRLSGLREPDAGELGVDGALQWLLENEPLLESSGLSPLQIDEVRSVLSKSRDSPPAGSI